MTFSSRLAIMTLLMSSQAALAGSLDNPTATQRWLELAIGNVKITQQGTGPALILLHANPGNALDYSAVRDDLAKHYRVIAVDWPGFGVAPLAETAGPVTGMFYYQAFVELVDALDLSSFAIIGHSMGGYIAARYAIEYPQRVAALVLVASAGFTPKNWLTTSIIRLMASPWAIPPGLVIKLGIRKRTPATEEMIVRAQTLHSDPDVRRVVRSIWGSFLVPEMDLSPSAIAITQPTLLMYGKLDFLVSDKLDGQVARQAMPHADVALMDSGHAIFAEVPEVFLQRVISFLRQANW